MNRSKKIYAKQQQIKLIDNILFSLCSIELNSDGRNYLREMKEKIQKELDHLKKLEEESPEEGISEAYLEFRMTLPKFLIGNQQ